MQVLQGGGLSFVSILARPVGRALLFFLELLAEHAAVSILARPVGRALRWPWGIISRWDTFQSSPAPWGERYERGQLWLSLRELVSILARPVGRALRF